MTSITINHLAVVVDNVERSLGFWRDALGLSIVKIEDVKNEAVRVAFLRIGDSHIELVEPTSDDSGIARYLSKTGAGFHHVCLDVDDLDGMMVQLSEKGVELINDTPRERDGKRYAFIHPNSTGGVLVELYQRGEMRVTNDI